MSRPTAERRDDDGWPIHANVLRSLSEDVRPPASTAPDDGDAAAANVRSCLAERVMPTAVDRLWRRLRENRWHHRQRPRHRTTAAAARRTQTLLMGVRSAYADGAYYAPGTSHVSRTVEELSLWTADDAAPPVVNGYTYTAGTVLYDEETGACYLHGFADPRNRVAVDCRLLTAALPRHRSTVKMYSVLRTAPADVPVLLPHHFQTFSRGAAFR